MSGSFLRWAGSKQKLIRHLKQYWNTGFERYIEPFMGSAKLFFSVDTRQAILSDTNSELVETFLQVQKNPYPVYKILKSFKAAKSEYYKIRSIDPVTMGSNQRAARFIYLNRLCFNGLYRTNTNGQFNVPYSGENSIKFEEELSKLTTASKKLSTARIFCGDFQKVVMENVQQGDFVYLDPPYAVQNRRIFKQYGAHTFGIDDLKRLSTLLTIIDQRQAKFLLSYAHCREALELFSEWTIEKTYVQRNISGFAKYRRRAAELLVTNICE